MENGPVTWEKQYSSPSEAQGLHKTQRLQMQTDVCEKLYSQVFCCLPERQSGNKPNVYQCVHG